MKILFYLEPHPVRERYESFSWIGRKICEMLEDQYVNQKNNKSMNVPNIKILTSRYYSELNIKYPELKKHFLGMSREENDSLKRFYGDWNTDTISVWEELMLGSGEVSINYNNILSRIKNEIFDFDTIIYWSTNGAVKSFAEKNSLYSIAMELGCTRKPFYETIYFDPIGVNGNALTGRIKVHDLPEADLLKIQNELPFYFKNHALIDAKHNVIKSKHVEKIYKEPNKNILIPLQLDDDSNIILFSKYNTMLDFLEDIIPKLIEAGYTCFIKPHPGSKDREITRTGHENCHEYCYGSKNVIWLDDIDSNLDYLALLDKMNAIVTINSSVGFEGMILGKLIITMGKSPYSLDGLPTIEDFLDEKIDFEEYYVNIAKIVNFMLFEYLAPRDLAFDFNYFVEYVNRAHKTYDLFTSCSNSEFTKEYIQQYNFSKDYIITLRNRM